VAWEGRPRGGKLQYHQAVSNTASSPSSNRSTVRFAVGKPEGPRSTVWRLWTHKNEVYISAWSLASDVKISLHSSGDWREALTTEHAAKGSPFVAPGQDRTIDKWQRPAEFVAGATKAFMIVVPSSEVTTPRHPEANTAFRQKLGGKAVVWVPAAPEGYALHGTVHQAGSDGRHATGVAGPEFDGDPVYLEDGVAERPVDVGCLARTA